jgi:hypothetical protein
VSRHRENLYALRALASDRSASEARELAVGAQARSDALDSEVARQQERALDAQRELELCKQERVCSIILPPCTQIPLCNAIINASHLSIFI